MDTIISPRGECTTPKNKGTSRRLSVGHTLGENKDSIEKVRKKKQSPAARSLVRVSVKLRTFGIVLPALLKRERIYFGAGSDYKVPNLITQTTEYIIKSEGIKLSGLFRLCGKHSDLITIKEKIDNGSMVTDELLSKLDIYTIADLLKLFLRLLPQPIIPIELYFQYFLAGTLIEDKRIYITYLGSLIKLLPVDNRNVLEYLCKFFKEVAKRSDENKMNASNLAIIFAPSIFGQSKIPDSSTLIIESKATSQLTHSFIEFFDLLFLTERAPARILVAYESHYDGDLAIIKGENVLAFKLEEKDETYKIIVAGRLFSVPAHVIELKCKPKFLIQEEKEEELFDEDLISKIREHALRVLYSKEEILHFRSPAKAGNSSGNNEQDDSSEEILSSPARESSSAISYDSVQRKRKNFTTFLRKSSEDLFSIVKKEEKDFYSQFENDLQGNSLLTSADDVLLAESYNNIRELKKKKKKQDPKKVDKKDKENKSTLTGRNKKKKEKPLRKLLKTSSSKDVTVYYPPPILLQETILHMSNEQITFKAIDGSSYSRNRISVVKSSPNLSAPLVRAKKSLSFDVSKRENDAISVSLSESSDAD